MAGDYKHEIYHIRGLQEQLENLDLSDYATISSLNNYAKKTDLSSYATTSSLSNYAKKTDLSSYATTSSLSNYAKKTDLSSYATTSSLSSYLKNSDVKSYISSTGKSTEGWYIKYSNGLIIQGGTLSITSDETSITFPTPFSSIPSVYLTRVTNRGQGSYDNELYPMTLSVSAFSYKMNTTLVTNATWFAIGY